MKNKFRVVIFICLLTVINISVTHAQNNLSDEIGIIVPRNVITNVIKAALPLKLETDQYLTGDLWIQAIDHIKIGSDKVEFDLNIRGKNVKIETKLGNQVLLMDIGNLNADLSCNASLRYDAPRRLLYITPNILQKTNENREDKIVANLLQILSLANGVEYPIEIEKLQPFITQIGSDKFSIDMDITNIRTENDKVLISGRPKLEKVK